MRNHKSLNFFSFSPPVIEEPKEPVDPAVRAKENWLRLYNKVLEQLREVRSQVHLNLNSGSNPTPNSKFQTFRPQLSSQVTEL